MKIDLIVIKTGNPQELVNFYSLIGIEFEYHNHGNGPFHFAGKINNTVFEIYSLPKNIEKPDSTLRLGFSIRQLDDMIERLRKANVKIIKEPDLTEWGYQALIEDLDGRKIELKDEDISVATYKIQDVFKITGRGIVFSGVIINGIIYTGDEITFSVNGIKLSRRITGMDVGMRKLPTTEPYNTGLMIQCNNENEIDELRQWKPEGQIGLIKNIKKS